MDTSGRVPLCDITKFVAVSPFMRKEDKMKRYFDGADYENKHKERKRILTNDDPEDLDYGLKDADYDPKDVDYDPKDVDYNIKVVEYYPKDVDYDPNVYSDSDVDSNSDVNRDSDVDFGPSRKYKRMKKQKTSPGFYKAPKHKNLSEYEKMVLKNKEEQMAFLKSLKINELKESFSEAVKKTRPKQKPLKTVKRCIYHRRSQQPRSPIPLRKSQRLSKIDINLSEEAIASSKVHETIQKKLPSVLPFSKALQEDDSYEDFNREFSDLEQGNTKPVVDYVSHFQNMQLPESQIAKVVYSRITSLAIHPMREKIIVAAGSKYGKIGFWNVNSDSNPYVFEPHIEGVTLLKFNPEHPNLLVSSSYDGTLRCGDLEKSVFNEAYNVSEETCCTYFDFLSPNTFLVAQKNGNVSVVDYRMRIKTSCKKHKCHDNPVKTVSVHPLDKSYFISAENKGIIRLWDLRKLQTQPIVEVQHHKRCAQSAFFSPLTGKSILTTSSDDTICLFDSSNLGKSVLFKHSLKHNNQTGRWLTPFRATWLPNTDDAFVVGSMLYPRKIEIYNEQMKNIFNFGNENLGCITSVNIFHPSLPVLAGSNSSGKVYVFSEKGF